MSRDERADELIEVAKVLQSDMKFAVQKLNDSTDSNFDFWARTYVKTLGSWIEGSLWAYKFILANSHIPKVLGFSVEEQLFLQDKRISKAGNIEKIKTPIKQNLKLFMKLMSKQASDNFQDFSGNGWQSLGQFFAIRDQLMHPKGLSNLKVSRNQIDEIEKGRIWLLQNFTEVQEVIKQASYKV